VADVAGLGDVGTELLEFVVLRRKARQGLGLEPGEVRDAGLAAGQALPERLDVVFEASDLGVAWVGDLARGTCLGEAPFEVFLQVGVGPVERRAGDTGGVRGS
jgi:hypothetical protein